MPTTENLSNDDLAYCDREPIHLLGGVQPHGVLLALGEPAFAVLQASGNLDDLLGAELPGVLGRSLDVLIGGEQGAALAADLRSATLQQTPLYLRTITVKGVSFHALAHRHDGVLLLELEPTPSAAPVAFHELYPLVRSSIARVQAADSFTDLCQSAAEEVRRITGFGRVLVYQFAANWDGHVVAEDRDESFASYLDLWFPASDIPRQAREMYRLTGHRLIVNACAVTAPLVPRLNPATGRPLDLSFAGLRAVSPIHLEYLGNMGLVASMSIAVVCDGRLWGLISCHDRVPHAVPFDVRTACELVGQYLAQQIAAQERAAELSQRVRLKAVQADLLAAMASEGDFVSGLTRIPTRLLEVAGAAGAAVLYADSCRLIGRTPSEAQVRRLSDWLAEAGEDLFYTDGLAEHFPEAATYVEAASGVLAAHISKLYRSYLVWFRPEVIQTVNWGGDPTKPVEPEPGGARLHPRKSFEQWKQTVRGRSLPWVAAEIATATDLRNDIVGIVLRKAEEVAQLASELQRSNEELESFSYSVSHDLRAPFRHIVGYGELLRERTAGRLDETEVHYLDNVLESGRYAGVLVDNLLGFAQMSRLDLNPVPIDIMALVSEIRRELTLESVGRTIDWKIDPLPRIRGDLELFRVVFRNLLANAVKYTRLRPDARIEVGAEQGECELIFFVRDNGVGFDMRYVSKLFGVFQRLHRAEDFEGTGIGLATVRRIVARHGGRTWAEGATDRGASFFIALPRSQGER